ncbi:MAG: hypothetical protein D6780_00860, partial [Candidatus Dadabacteria bacterium]
SFVYLKKKPRGGTQLIKKGLKDKKLAKKIFIAVHKKDEKKLYNEFNKSNFTVLWKYGKWRLIKFKGAS